MSPEASPQAPFSSSTKETLHVFMTVFMTPQAREPFFIDGSGYSI